MTQIYLLPVDRWLTGLILASAVLSGSDRQVCFVDLKLVDYELESLDILLSRLYPEVVDLTGDRKIKEAMKNKALSFQDSVMPDQLSWEDLVEQFGKPDGIVIAPAGSPSKCLKAAALAVRLGYFFYPLQGEDNHGLPLTGDLYRIWLGNSGELEKFSWHKEKQGITCLENDRAIIDFLVKEGYPVDYLVILNSADLIKNTESGNCLRELWVRGLSLHALLLASYRNIFIYDVDNSNPIPWIIEKEVNEMVRETGLQPSFQAVLASPAVIPFFYEEKKGIGAVTEEMVRDIHVRLNNDLFFDLAEGRLMQNNPAGLSVQLICTKLYREIQKQSSRRGKNVLIVDTPHVETGIIFSTDVALIDTQLIPLVEEAGYEVNQLRDREAHFRKVSQALTESDYFLFTGHGGPEALHTHGRSLNREDLPLLPPLIAYASACSTVALVPHWYSANEGLDWQGIPVDSRQVIGLSFVEKGALCFIGGATIEDLQYTTSTYSVFLEALLLKGLSVGEAVREMRHVISLYASTLMQKNPEGYRKYRWGTANAIHQQILLGDPAFVPAESSYTKAALPRFIEGETPVQKITIDIPDDRWRRNEAPINPKDASKYYYRCRNVEVITPYGEDIFSWGDYYRIAPDAKNISEYAVKSSFLHLSFDLPPGLVPKKLALVDAELGESECLLCGEAVEHDDSPTAAMKKFKLPYLLQPPIELNMEEGWAYSTELADGFIRIRWLAPLLLIDENSRSAYPLKNFTFQIESEPGVWRSGRIVNPNDGYRYLISAGKARDEKRLLLQKEPLINSCTAAITDEQGCFEIFSPPETVIEAQEQFPLYNLLEKYQTFRKRIYELSGDGNNLIELEPVNKLRLSGFLFDSKTGKPINGALIRVFRGEPDPVGDPLIEAYVGEVFTTAEGSFTFNLPAGRYMIYGAAEIDGTRYKSAEWIIRLREGEEVTRIFSLDQAAVVRGKVSFEGYIPPDPPVIALKRFPKVEGEGPLAKVPILRDGSYECLVNYQDRFQIVLEEEGWEYIYDTNGEKGYKLEPQEILERSYRLVPGSEQEE
ncbi:MAG: C25 family cysteine peptidase [Bacillota bacterium]|nr:C25 family cysteine peptidase [Bacillota bacterium]